MFDFRRLLPARPSQQRADQFQHIMEIATGIGRKNPSALRDLVRALLRPLQSEHLIAVAEREQHAAPREICGDWFFFNLNPVLDVYDCRLRPTPFYEVSLVGDVVLPTPWNRDRYELALATIGSAKGQGVWRQDLNHTISVWLPWGIAFVTGGNHSITAGILAGEGVIVANEVYDLARIFDLVACDGYEYKDVRSGQVVGLVNDYRRAAVFEIGRLMLRDSYS
ncbi:DUF6710 family protein [Chitinimonas naiadis]